MGAELLLQSGSTWEQQLCRGSPPWLTLPPPQQPQSSQQPRPPPQPTFHANLAGCWVGAVVKRLAPGQPCFGVWALELVGGIVLAGGGKVEL